MDEINPSIELDEHPASEGLDFTFSEFGKPIIDRVRGTVVLPAREFKVSAGFYEYDEDLVILEGEIIFEKVKSSIRCMYEIDETISEAISTTQYKNCQYIDDGPFPDVVEKVYSLYIGGFTYNPEGWMEWNLEIASIKIIAYKLN